MVCQCCLFRRRGAQKIMEDTSNNKTLSHIKNRESQKGWECYVQ